MKAKLRPVLVRFGFLILSGSFFGALGMTPTGMPGAAHASESPTAGASTVAPVKIPCIEREVDPTQEFVITGEDFKPGEIALTFDDGPAAGVTRPILNTLEKYGVRATFFEVGEMVKAHPDLALEVIKRGHTVGTHTYTHPSLPTLPVTEAENEIRKTIKTVDTANGGMTSPFFRFPFLYSSPALRDFVRTSGMTSFFWNDISLMTQLKSVPEALEGTPQDHRQGGIVISHDLQASSAEVLPAFLEQMRKKHYTAVVFVLAKPHGMAGVVAAPSGTPSVAPSPKP